MKQIGEDGRAGERRHCLSESGYVQPQELCATRIVLEGCSREAAK